MKRSALLLVLVIVGTASPARAGGDEVQEWIFPIVVNGPAPGFRYQTTFSFVNLSATSGRAEVRGFREGASSESRLFCPIPLNIPTPPDTTVASNVPIAGSGVARLVSSGETERLFTGWARAIALYPDAPPPTAEISLLAGPPQSCGASEEVPPPRMDVGETPSPLLIGSVQLPAVLPAREFTVETAITPFRHTALAFVNPSGMESVDVAFTLLDAEGRPVVSTSFRPCFRRFTLGPLERRVDFAGNLVPAVGINISLPCVDGPGSLENFQGTARIVADGPIAVGALHVLLPDGRIVNARVTPAADQRP